MKRLFSIISLVLILAISTVATVNVITPVQAYSDGSDQSNNGTATTDKLIEGADTALDSLNVKAANISIKIAIFMLLACLIALMFTKDSRKISGLITTLGIIALAFLGIQIVSHGWITDWIMQIGDKYFK